MEVYIRDLEAVGTELETKIVLLREISKRIHRPPILGTNELKSNFNVDINPVRDEALNRSSHPNFHPLRSSYNNQRLTGTVTFPTIALGQKFLEDVRQNPIKIFNNLHSVSFEPFLKDGRRIIPHPQLIKSLKDSRFKEIDQSIQELEEAELIQKPLGIKLIQFGRTCQHGHVPAFSSEYSIDLPPENSSCLKFDLDRKVILLSWTLEDRCKSIVIKLHSLLKIEACSPWVLFWLDLPPQFEEVLKKNPSYFSGTFKNRQHKKEFDLRIRVHGFPHAKESAFPYVNNQLCIQFSNDAAFQQFCSFKVCISLPKVSLTERAIVDKDHYDPDRIKDIHQHLVCLSIPAAFQIECLLHNSILLPYQILRVCKAIDGVDQILAERALIKFTELYTDYIDQHDGIPAPPQNRSKPIYLHILQKALELSDEKSPLTDPNVTSGDSFPCRTVAITPTRLFLQGPLSELSNSILRLYQQTQNFLRVSVVDENGLSLRSSPEVDIQHLLRSRYLPFLTKGLILCGRKFEFLGYSNSALRDHQAWFVCPFYQDDQIVTAASIRAKLGDFTKVIRIPARYMARIAQAFTTTRRSLTLRPSEITRMSDVERNQSCFTDGVGTISQALVNEVHSVLNQGSFTSRSTNRPTCYQIRLGGFKGMLSLDPTLKGRVVRMRPSMDKFDAPDSLTLDIAGTFLKPLVAYLNRPLIKLLEDLGIPARVFLKLQQKIARKVENSRSSPKLAGDLMNQYSLASASGMASTLKKLSDLLGDKNIGVQSDFVEECYDLMIMQCLRDLKYRGRIPLEKSYTLVGVADEDNFLPPDSIYVCVQYPNHHPQYLKGKFAISRSPSLHPGDVRVVTAVGRLDPKIAPRLSSLVNCVAFPIQGERSLPSCLGGGDLDGDLYTIIGLPALVPNPAAIHPPASYITPTMRKLDRDCTISDGANFFLDYISSDLVGTIATRHLCIADQCTEGTRHESCIRLAELHSDAVDYPKTGVPISIRALPFPPFRLKPDFMCQEHDSRRKGEEYYESSRVLGRLFREIPADKIDLFIFHSSSDGDTIESYRRRNTDQKLTGLYGNLDPNNLLTRLIQERIQLKFRLDSNHRLFYPDEELKLEFEELLDRYRIDLMKICKLNSLSRNHSHHLTESEAFLGIIIISCDRFQKRTALSRLFDQTSNLFDLLKTLIIGPINPTFIDLEDDDDEDDDDEPLEGDLNYRIVKRTYAAWLVATQAPPDSFGTHSFGFLALGILLSMIMDSK